VHRLLSAASTIAIVIASLLLFSGTAYAHERRMIGPYQVIIGWLNEPAYVGQLNSLDLRISDTRQNPAAPVTDLEKTLVVEVAAGGLAPYKLTVSARFGTAGAYNGYVMPTVVGTYSFHITGKIDTLTVDEKFTSGPNTFGDIQDTAALQYPAKIPVGDELGKKLDAISSGVDQTRIIALGALVVALAGIGAAIGAGLLFRRRSP
jgi:hypothetical protein